MSNARDELRERLRDCSPDGQFSNRTLGIILRLVDAYVAEREKPMACGHRGACWVIHDKPGEGYRVEGGEHEFAFVETDYCAACERERRLVETALRMCGNWWRGDGSAKFSYEDVLREADVK
jgi:hypothetical protein